MSEIEESLKKFVAICNKYSLSGSFNIVNDIDNVFPSNLLARQSWIIYMEKIILRS